MNRMTRDPNTTKTEDSPRAILRVPEVLQVLATAGRECSAAELSQLLDVPKTSLRRLLLTLENRQFLAQQNGRYALGPASFRLAQLIVRSKPPAALTPSARPTMEWLSQHTREGVMLAVLSEDAREVIYIDIIASLEKIGLSIPLGNRRPVNSSAAGRAVLAFQPVHQREELLRTLDFEPLTPHTARREDLPELLDTIAAQGVAFDSGGVTEGASSIASPIFDAEGTVRSAISIAGLSNRIDSRRAALEDVVRQAGERISRALGYLDDYPAPPGV